MHNGILPHKLLAVEIFLNNVVRLVPALLSCTPSLNSTGYIVTFPLRKFRHRLETNSSMYFCMIGYCSVNLCNTYNNKVI